MSNHKNTDPPIDTGTLAEVEPAERLDVDEGAGSYAGSSDISDILVALDDPGEVVDLEAMGQDRGENEV